MIPVAALGGGIQGFAGRTALSFFNPVMAGVAGSFASFAGMGAIACPLIIIPHLLTAHFFNKSAFLNTHPNLKGVLLSTNNLLLTLGAVTTAAVLLGMPSLGATVIAMMIVPTLMFALSTLYHAVKACIDLRAPAEAAEEDIAAPAYAY
jgi:hypothetical protein